MFIFIDEIKPILRPLSSMVDSMAEETGEDILDEICEAIGVAPHLYYQAFNDILTGLSEGDWGGLTVGYIEMALIVKILCKHSIDMFDLIAQGEAIDADSIIVPDQK